MAQARAVPKALKDAVKGLLFPSETDAPVEAFVWPAGTIDAASVVAAAGAPARTAVTEMTVTEFFRAIPSALRPHYFDLLVAMVDHLSGVKVFKLGDVRATVYVVGTTEEGHRAGVHTTVVET